MSHELVGICIELIHVHCTRGPNMPVVRICAWITVTRVRSFDSTRRWRLLVQKFLRVRRYAG